MEPGAGPIRTSLFNAGTEPVDLTDYLLTDDLTNPSKFRIPPGYVIPPGGFLLVWADEETGQNQSNRVDLHVNFKLSVGGESIRLSAPDGALVDSVTFGQQTNDVSQGRFADGAAAIYFMPTPTPRGPNTLGASANTSPQIAPIADKTITLGQRLFFTVPASDSDTPAQLLAHALDGIVPAGATLEAATGLFSWMPAPAQAPSTNSFVVRVTDSGLPPLSATRAFTVFVMLPPKLSAMTGPVNGQVSITWETAAGKSYRVQFKNDLGESEWQPLGDPRVAAGTSLTITDSLGASPQRFYRIVILD